MEGMRNELAEESRKLDARTNEHDLLKSLIDSMDGYPESVKFLHNNTSWNKDAPLLSDIIYVKETYRAAVENVLEQYLNYYVVNDLGEGLQAIHLLDEHKKGKANFFLLDKFTGTETAHQPESTIPALDVAEFDPKYQNLAKHLLGNVFIAENEDALKESNGAVILEKTGKFVKGKYSITGGSVGLFEGKKIGRVKNLEKLQKEITAQKVVVSALKAAIQQRYTEITGYHEDLQEAAVQQAQQDINQLTNLVFSLRNKSENLHQQETAGKERTAEMNLQLQQNQTAIADTRSALDTFNIQLAKLTATLQNTETEYSAAEEEYTTATTGFNEGNLSLTKQQSKVVSLQTEHSFKSDQLNELKSRVENSAIQLRDADEAINTTAEALKELEALVLQLLQNKATEEKQLNEADQAYHNLRNVLTEKESELRHKQRSKESIDTLLNEIKDKLTDLKLQLSGMKERLSVEFKVDLDTIIDEPRTCDAEVEELKEKNERMRKRLENMGEINPTAIEAYTEMKKRYEFIFEQKNDLVTAKESLMQTIQEVEATANQQFLETFNRTRENFQKVFKALFTEEDTADLILVDPENLAESGIDIIAKPKGKRPSSIGQLSGGEKTLTATALLFAIYLIKPAPFCILDEVDAPLDDANVGKFTNMIRQFSENSQFIIVTHNKQTMSAVDVIYGVTMQEAGVSKLVPVDFRNLN